MYFSFFNKFAIFILYGLISIVVITLAQGGEPSSNCVPKPMVSKTPQVMIGYVQLFTNQSSTIEPKNIPWDLYDYINVIGKMNKSLFSHLSQIKTFCLNDALKFSISTSISTRKRME
jgi:hypothetical protein